MNDTLLIELNDFLNDNDLFLDSDDLDFITGITWKTHLPLKCKKCNEEFTITTKQLLRPHPDRDGKVCPRCNSEDSFINKIIEIYGNNPYEFKTTFKGYDKPLRIKCKKCGYEWTTRAARNLLMGRNLPNKAHPCKKCSGKRNFSRPISELETELEKKFSVCNYEFLSDSYKGNYSKEKIRVKCKKCGYEFETFPQNLLNPRNKKHYCKNCNMRKGARDVTSN